MKISNDVRYIGVNDHEVDLFEGQYHVPNGMSYNSYVILDEQIAVMNTVDARFGSQWLCNLESALSGRTPDYLVVQHMEPDHSANINVFMARYPAAPRRRRRGRYLAPGQAYAVLCRCAHGALARGNCYL